MARPKIKFQQKPICSNPHLERFWGNLRVAIFCLALRRLTDT